jgi:hypothetical protein
MTTPAAKTGRVSRSRTGAISHIPIIYVTCKYTNTAHRHTVEVEPPPTASGQGLHEVRRPRVEHTARGPTFRAGLLVQPCTSTVKQSTRFGLRRRPTVTNPTPHFQRGVITRSAASGSVSNQSRPGALTARAESTTALWMAVSGTIPTRPTTTRQDSQVHHTSSPLRACTATTSDRSNLRNSRSYRLVPAPQALLNSNELR